LRKYNKDVCWQYNIRLNNLDSDLLFISLTPDDISKLRCSDFKLQYEDKDKVYNEIKLFIEKHEWLGKMSLYPTHIFTARYKGLLAGVVVMDMPITYSNILGIDTKKIERLISRGACISWSPKNLASKLIMFAIKWMVDNTQYRLFSAYSDTEAKEIGTIYQACNFYYIGQTFGTGYKYKINLNKYVSDRYFRSRSVYKKLAKNNGINWKAEWQTKDVIHFDKMPEKISIKIKQLSKDYQNSCEKIKIESKHKYIYILGKTKSETKKLRKQFKEQNKIYSYPKRNL